ncbi:hypothetical protein SLEP1_g9414 [Rubroshorea leprosula]|uniref:Reverse transcriptase n=1 Tax=Rubroshorea leprosula TaxID=152421 RepID=A0AAV5I4U2_9ROSI|nr:hypothetical protein SLEP1_g9414 [Rubroshorea leprosula]
MVEQFCQKNFQSEECITILDLHNTRQCPGEDLMGYVKRFRDLALDCYGGHAESFLVEICINIIFPKYCTVLENIGINQFARLFDAAKRTAIFVKAISNGKSTAKSTEKKTVAHTLTVSIRCLEKKSAAKDKDKKREIARRRATEAIFSIVSEAGGECLNADAHASRAYLESSNVATFTDEDMECELVDTGSSFNLIPLSTIIATRIPQRRLVKSPLSIVGSGNSSEHALGYIQLELKVDVIQSQTTFYVIDAEVSYHILLGRPCLHQHKIVPSTYHQCVKGRLNGRVFRISANPLPFDQIETHFVEISFYDELAPSGEAMVSRLGGIVLPAWNDIKDNLDLDLQSVLEQKRQKKEAAKIVQARPKCTRTVLPDGAALTFATSIRHAPTMNSLSPNMDVLMDNTTGCEMYSLMDGSSGYNQISMCPNDVEKTAFRTYTGNFDYVVMPFGLKNVGATYQRVMVAIFHDFIHIYIEIYIDDIVVKSKTRLGCFDVLRTVFDRCCLCKLKMNLAKCAFDVSARKFLGLFIPSLAEILSAFSLLLKKGATFVWMAEQQHAFSHLQDLMLRLLIISVPIQGIPLKVYLSTSNKAMSALVAQDEQEGKEQPIYYVSRNLKGTKSRKLRKNGHYTSMCTNNTTDYEAYVNGLAMAKKAGVQHLKIIGNSGLILGQVQGECGEHQGWRKLYEQLLAYGYYWPNMKQDAVDFVRRCHTCHVHASLIHSHPNLLQHMKTPWPFHTWGLDLIGPIHPSSEGYIWILVVIGYWWSLNISPNGWRLSLFAMLQVQRCQTLSRST